MKSLRTILVDDESPARRRVRDLCEGVAEIELVGEAADGEEALKLVDRLQPDLIFLDVQMPFVNGVQIADRLNKRVMIIFVTAHENFALDAFDHDVVDYLLKPFSNERFFKAVNKASMRLQERSSLDFQKKVGKLLDVGKDDWLDSIKIKIRGLEYDIDIEDVLYFQGNGNYVTVVTQDKKYTYRSTLSSLQNQLSPSTFLRIHKSTLINFHHVMRSRYTGVNNEFHFQMKDGKGLTSGRQYKKDITDFTSKREL